MARQEFTMKLTEDDFAAAGAGIFGVYHKNQEIKAKINAKAKAILEVDEDDHDFESVLIMAAAAPGSDAASLEFLPDEGEA